MFTGIIKQMGRVASIANNTVTVATEWRDLELGESISVNGVCVTVAKKGNSSVGESFSFDLSPETMKRTTLGRLSVGSKVNLERALKVGDRLGGHFLSGHIDGVGKVSLVVPGRKGKIYEITAPQEILRYMVPQGSVGIDGVSLTVVQVGGAGFSVCIIPHTEKVTTFGGLRVNDLVNIEVDILAKYLEKLIAKKSLSVQDLGRKGFL